MSSDILLLVVSVVVIIVGAELFANAVEWIGVRLSLSEGTVGSVLAAFVYRSRRIWGWRLRVNREVVSRDLGFFLPRYGAAIAASFSPVGHAVRWLVAAGRRVSGNNPPAGQAWTT
jgi:hypothetical protein